MVDELSRDVFNRLQVYVHQTETPEALRGGKFYDCPPPSFYYGELLTVQIPDVMNLFYVPQMIGCLPETEFGGYLFGFPNRLQMGHIGSSPTLNEEQTLYVRENTLKIMQRIYETIRFPVGHRSSIDDLLVVSVLWGENWHIGLHRGLNREMQTLGLDHLY